MSGTAVEHAGLDGVLGRALELIRDIPDYPSPGILFKDITPLLQDPGAFEAVVAAMAAPHLSPAGGPSGGAAGNGAAVRSSGREGAPGLDAVVGIEARGFILGAPVALALGTSFVPVRKKGKLPHATLSSEYALEYGTATVEIHQDALRPGDRVLVVDDVLATGGTLAAACGLVERLGARVVGAAVLLELAVLRGRGRLVDRPVRALLSV